MKTLGGSYLKFFTCKQREKESVVWCSREIALGRQEIGFLGHQKRVRDGFSLAVSFQPKCVHPISAVSSPQTNIESEEIQTTYSDQPKTVHVRFKLQKECAFGQRFLIVGDDQILGLWDPSDGVPLNWSDGHVWTAEMDIPCGQVIKYKFILKGDTENVLWQPGVDRILATWDTEKIITVFEDWDNPQLQNIVEEEVVVDLDMHSLISSDLFIVAENLSQSHEESLDDLDLLVDKETNVIDEHDHMINHGEKPSSTMVAENITKELEEQDLSSTDKGLSLMSVTVMKMEEMISVDDEARDERTNVIEEHGHINHGEKPSSTMVAENIITKELDEQDLSSTDKGSSLMSVTVMKMGEMISENDDGVVEESNFLKAKDETLLVLDDGVPVLVPGLVLMPPEEIEAAEVNQVEDNIVDNTTTIGFDETEAELKDEHVSASLHYAETSETTTMMMMMDEKQQMYGTEHHESNILESDMQWGRRTLQKFLANFGIPIII